MQNTWWILRNIEGNAEDDIMINDSYVKEVDKNHFLACSVQSKCTSLVRCQFEIRRFSRE